MYYEALRKEHILYRTKFISPVEGSAVSIYKIYANFNCVEYTLTEIIVLSVLLAVYDDHVVIVDQFPTDQLLHQAQRYYDTLGRK